MVDGNQRPVELAGVEGVDSETFLFAKSDAGHGHGWRSSHVFTFIAEYMGPINRQRHMVLERVVKIRLVIRDETTSTSTPGIYNGAANGKHLGMARNSETNHVQILVEHPYG